MIRSLRWKLLAWYAAVLTASAMVFAGLWYVNVRRSMEGEMDAELRFQAITLADVLIPTGADMFAVELSPKQVDYFSGEGDAASHYAIWRSNRALIDSSDPLLDIPAPQGLGGRNRNRYREYIVRGPAGTWVLAGKDVHRRQQQLRSSLATSLGVGAASLALMLVGGWFLTTRALAPIERISRAASSVSASNLSERIDATRMESELAGLAQTINAAFDRLEQAFEQQARFTADASHELRTPLSIVLSHADYALKIPRTEAEYRDALAAVRRAAQRMKGVVEGLLTLARADAGQIQFNNEPVALHDVISETCCMFEPLATDKQVAIAPNLEPVTVIGDRDRLCEAVANLVSNAIQYNQPGGRVDVTLTVHGQLAVLKIADTGPGIPEADRLHIFERFYRVDKARSRSIDGSGLGLAITKWIINGHGGSISHEASNNGGAVFIVMLDRCFETTAQR